MAAPTQVYPPWLTAVPTVIVDSNGVPIATETTVLFLPLTYYGPSIPLGSDWVYGGLTSPASTSTTIPVTTTSEIPTITTTPSLTTTTATPTSLPTTLTSITSTATPTTISSSVSLSTSSTTPPTLSSTSAGLSATAASGSATPSPLPAASHHLSRGQIVSIIVASILGVMGIFIFAISYYLCRKNRRRRSVIPTGMPVSASGAELARARTTSLWTDRDPRPSGGEADPFLAQTTPDITATAAGPEMTQHTNAPPYAAIARIPVPSGSSSSKGSSGTKSSGTNHSGYGDIMAQPTLNLHPNTTQELERQRRGQILTPEELGRINEESALPESDIEPTLGPDEGWSSGSRYTGIFAGTPRPPVIRPYGDRSDYVEGDLDPNEGWTTGQQRRESRNIGIAQKLSQGSLSAYPDANEDATLLTARRVRVEDLASRSPAHPTGDLEGSTKNRNLFASLGLDRLSWFKNSDNGSRRNSRHSYPEAEDDAEMGQALLTPSAAEFQATHRTTLGLSEKERPASSASGTSGGTVYHDARSSPSGTPVSTGTPVTPLPRALTPSASGQQRLAASPVHHVPGPGLPQQHSSSSSITNVNYGLPVGYDILDTPAPSALTSSTRTSHSSELTQNTDSLPFPPGLSPAPQKSWTDGSTITHVSPVSLPVNLNPVSIMSARETEAGISIDLLEEAPPSAGLGWRSMAAEQGIFGGGRRTTFGVPIPGSDLISEEGSIYSAISHLSPTCSTGSDPASARRDLSGSMSSASSRPSALSATYTHSSGHSLSHSHSTSFDARRRGSPAMSAFGSQSRSRSPQPALPLLNAPPAAHYPAERAGTHRLTGSHDSDAERGGMSSPEPLSPISQLSSAPWAGGLGDNWMPTP
ncbi:hypothetical protein H0H92_013362 [Tricholoma furcatifolium]|nr:hypothetical protein H0H92_013362 [Tricholoma furcatifolium]